MGRVVALAVVVALVVLVVTPVAAGEPVATVSISSITIPLGEQGVVEVRASATKPGLGAWAVDVTYDRDVARSVDCEGFNGTHCGRLFEENTDRLTGASATGLVGDTLLATITFECGDEPGWTLLALSLSVFTVADPQDGIDPTGVQNGFVSTRTSRRRPRQRYRHRAWEACPPRARGAWTRRATSCGRWRRWWRQPRRWRRRERGCGGDEAACGAEPDPSGGVGRAGRPLGR